MHFSQTELKIIGTALTYWDLIGNSKFESFHMAV